MDISNSRSTQILHPRPKLRSQVPKLPQALFPQSLFLLIEFRCLIPQQLAQNKSQQFLNAAELLPEFLFSGRTQVRGKPDVPFCHHACSPVRPKAALILDLSADAMSRSSASSPAMK